MCQRNGASSIKPAILLLALLVDRLGGELPTRLHPVGWMGRYLTWLTRWRPDAPRRALLAGLGGVLLGWGLFTGAAALVMWGFQPLPRPLRLLLLALLLKPTLSVSALTRAGAEVRGALERHDLPEARRLLGYHLVSRDTAELSESEVAGAAVESLAENLTDSIIAPIFYFVLWGLPGAVLYRFVNTADAVVGYRTPELEHFGKAAARLDDLSNLVPARLAAGLLLVALPFVGGNAAEALRIMWRDAYKTPSPNAGWTMAAVAGGLSVRLDKRGVYTLHPEGRPVSAEDVRAAERLIPLCTGLTVLLVLVLEMTRA